MARAASTEATRSPGRCKTSVGVSTDLNTSRTSISMSACQRCFAIVGLAPRRCARPKNSRDSVDFGDRRQEEVDERTLAPPRVDLLQLCGDFIRRETPGMRRRIAREARRGAVEHEATHALGIRRREEETHRATFGRAEQRSIVYLGRIHYRAQVVHALVERRSARDGVGQPGPPLVPHDEARRLRKQVGQRGESVGGVVVGVDIRDPPRNGHEWRLAVTDHAIREPHGSVTRVLDRARDHRGSLSPLTKAPRHQGVLRYRHVTPAPKGFR